MKKNLTIGLLLILLMAEFSLSAQNNSLNGKALNFPTSKYGISIGNSYEFTGIRINFADENVKKINGLNVTFWLKHAKNQNAVVNGVSIGVIPTAGTMQFINLGLLGVGTNNNLNGVSIGGVVVGSGGNINGLSVSGLITMADGDKSVISGIAISGIGIGAHKTINGFAVTAGYLEAEIFNGIAIAGYANINKMNGLTIALFNRTKELHGVQFGLINYAKNNPKGLRILPLINLHL